MRHRLLIGAAATVTIAAIAAACSDLPTPPAHRSTTAPSGSSADLTASATTGDSPQLLVCSTSDSDRTAETTIGPSGGSLAIGATRIDIPAGAVTTSTKFEMDVPPTDTMRVEIHAAGYGSFTFQQPATITIDYGRCASAVPPGALLEGVYVNSSTGQVLQRMGATVDTLAHTVSFWTGHLSGYAVAY